MARLRIILGTMSIGGTLNETQSHKMIKDFLRMGYDELDTAIMYQNGKTEQVMGKLHACRDTEKVKIACKVNPNKGLSAENVVEQLDTSLRNLQCLSCDILYLHFPDHDIPIEETLKGVDQLHKEGKFKEFGLSNYASWQVADIYHICKDKGYVLPTVYQGMYNALTRDIEMKLFPVLRRFGIRFYAYNPLAGGLLTGKFDFSKPDEEQPVGRFFANSKSGDFTNKWVKAYQDRYWRQTYKDGVGKMESIIKETYDDKVSLLQASLRWLRYHSLLQENDGIILGYEKEEHVNINLSAIKIDEPLHGDVLQGFQNVWNNIKSKCPLYFR